MRILCVKHIKLNLMNSLQPTLHLWNYYYLEVKITTSRVMAVAACIC